MDFVYDSVVCSGKIIDGGMCKIIVSIKHVVEVRKKMSNGFVCSRWELYVCDSSVCDSNCIVVSTCRSIVAKIFFLNFIKCL